MKKLYTVKLQVCIGKKKPIPIPEFPALPCYVFLGGTEPSSKAQARKDAAFLLKHNPGYVFVIQTAEPR